MATLGAISAADVPAKVAAIAHKVHGIIISGQPTTINQNNIIEVPGRHAITVDGSTLITVIYSFKAHETLLVEEVVGGVMPYYKTHHLSFKIIGISSNLVHMLDTFVLGLKDNATPWDDLLGGANRIIHNLRSLGQLPGMAAEVSIVHGGSQSKSCRSNSHR